MNQAFEIHQGHFLLLKWLLYMLKIPLEPMFFL